LKLSFLFASIKTQPHNNKKTQKIFLNKREEQNFSTDENEKNKKREICERR